MLLKLKKNKIIGIHQPNFLPWLGYFNKIVSSDVFILLDHVQFPKSGGVWINRNTILEDGQKTWATIPVYRNFSGIKRINQIQFANINNWRTKYMKKMIHSYSRANFFYETYDFLENTLFYETELLSDYNIHLIHSVLKVLDISDYLLLKSSNLDKVGYSNELLCSLVKSVKGDTYLCGGGANSYMDESIFKKYDIHVLQQGYKPVAYPQLNTKVFIPGLSVIDAMMNCGFEATKNLIVGKNNV
jgi:hypothetical protein